MMCLLNINTILGHKNNLLFLLLNLDLLFHLIDIIILMMEMLLLIIIMLVLLFILILIKFHVLVLIYILFLLMIHIILILLLLIILLNNIKFDHVIDLYLTLLMFHYLENFIEMVLLHHFLFPLLWIN